MRVVSASIAALLLLVAGAAQKVPDALLFHRYDLNAVCNDGSRAALYYRNCTGNWDRKPGQAEDFCEDPASLGVAGHRWLVLFDDGLDRGGAFCYDERSCAARNKTLTSSTLVGESAFYAGATSPFPELNPNDYLASAVVVPGCTSDLFAGVGGKASVGSELWSFGGAAVVEAALRALYGDLLPHNAARADSMVLVGGPGVLARVDELAALLRQLKRSASGNASATLGVYAVCDGGCVLLPELPAYLPERALCSRDDDCPPALALPALESFAGGLMRPDWCDTMESWRCYTAPALLMSWAAATTPVLLSAPQYDSAALRTYGADVAVPAALQWAQREYAPAARAIAAASKYAFSAACARSTSAFSNAWFKTLVPKHETNPPHGAASISLSAALVRLISCSTQSSECFGTSRDDCPQQEGCNPSGCAE
jgi:hypothetical protein